MPKRLSKPQNNDWFNDSLTTLRKKIKTENDFILERTAKSGATKIGEIDLTEHELNKFLLIFHTLLETAENNEVNNSDECDGSADIIFTIVKEILCLIAKNSNDLKLPNFLQKTLRVIKSIFDGTKSKAAAKGSPMEKESEEPSSEASSSSPGGSAETASECDCSSTPEGSP